MTPIVRNTLFFWLCLILFSIFLTPVLFREFIFLDVPIEHVPEGYWFLPICFYACSNLLRFVITFKYLAMLFINMKKFDELSQNEAAQDKDFSETRFNYLLFPLAAITGFIYGGITAIYTTGLVFFSGAFRLSGVALVFIGIVFVLVRRQLITLYLYEKFMQWIDEEKEEKDLLKKN